GLEKDKESLETIRVELEKREKELKDELEKVKKDKDELEREVNEQKEKSVSECLGQTGERLAQLHTSIVSFQRTASDLRELQSNSLGLIGNEEQGENSQQSTIRQTIQEQPEEQIQTQIEQ
ncbi:14476_t:CDS:2, partial [Funneliformis geosporum]